MIRPFQSFPRVLSPVIALIITGFYSGTAVAAPPPAARPKPLAATPARPPAARTAALALPGLRQLPKDPLLIGAVQVNAIDNFMKMLTGNTDREASGADMLAGALQLLKDQIDGPLSVGLYPDATGKSFSLLMAAHLGQSALTRELLNGVLTLGGDEKNPAKKVEYKGQSLISVDLPKAQPGSAGLPLNIQPTFTITNNDYLLIGTSLPMVKQSIDTGLTTGGGLGGRADLNAMLRDFPLSPTTDVWLFLPKPTGSLAAVKTPLPLPISGLPIGATVAALRFTPSGVRFEGLASVDRVKTAQNTP